jgi:hypothetical protein
VKNGRDEAGYCSRGTGTGKGNGRAKAHDRSVCFDTGHCRVDHRGRAACQGAGHQQAISSSDISHNGQRWIGENDPRKYRALNLAAKIAPALSSRPMCRRSGFHSAVTQFIHDQVKGTGRNSVFGSIHRVAAAWSRIWSKRAPKGLHFEHWSPLHSVESKGTPVLNRRLLTEGL